MSAVRFPPRSRVLSRQFAIPVFQLLCSQLRPFAQSWEILFPSLPFLRNAAPILAPSPRHLTLCTRFTPAAALSLLGTSHAPFTPRRLPGWVPHSPRNP